MKTLNITKTQKITISAICIALYIVIMLATQGFAFGQYQIRIATAVYGLSAIFPFLIIPMAIANCLSNTIMGGLGPIDMIGGGFVGALTCFVIVRTRNLPSANIFNALAIIFIPGLIVPIWLSYLLNIPYLVLMPSVLVGQIVPGIVGSMLASTLKERLATYKQCKTN